MKHLYLKEEFEGREVDHLSEDPNFYAKLKKIESN